MSLRPIGQDVERDPLLPKSQFTGKRLFGSLRYHVVLNGHKQWKCGCGPDIRGVDGYSKLGRNRRKDSRFAEMYRYRWARRK